jgi:hypothetical protein
VHHYSGAHNATLVVSLQMDIINDDLSWWSGFFPFLTSAAERLAGGGQWAATPPVPPETLWSGGHSPPVKPSRRPRPVSLKRATMSCTATTRYSSSSHYFLRPAHAEQERALDSGEAVAGDGGVSPGQLALWQDSTARFATVLMLTLIEPGLAPRGWVHGSSGLVK